MKGLERDRGRVEASGFLCMPSIFSRILLVVFAVCVMFAVVLVSVIWIGTEQASAADVKINKVNFPDKYFRKYLSKRYKGNVISEAQLAKTKMIDVASSKVSSLKGIEHFYNLKELYCSSYMTEADVNQTDEIYEAKNQNKITSLDVSQNKKLEILMCSTGFLENLNTKGADALKELDCSNNDLKKIDLSENPFLEDVQCQGNDIEELDITGNRNIIKLDCTMNRIKELDLGACNKIEVLECGFNYISKLDLSANTKLHELGCSANKLSKLDISKNLQLTEVTCQGNRIKELVFGKNKKLEMLYCGYNKIKTLDLADLSGLTMLECQGNKLKELNVKKCKKLETLRCNSNKIEKLDLRKNKRLDDLDCSFNRIRRLYLGKKSFSNGPLAEYNQMLSLNAEKVKEAIYLRGNGQRFEIKRFASKYDLKEYDKAIRKNRIKNVKGAKKKGTTFSKIKTGKIRYKYVIKRKEDAKMKVSVYVPLIKMAKKVRYRGKPATPKVKVYFKGKKLSKGQYTVEYRGNKKPGKAKVIIRGKKDFKGKVTKIFRILKRKKK